MEPSFRLPSGGVMMDKHQRKDRDAYSPLSSFDIVVPSPAAITWSVMTPASRLPRSMSEMWPRSYRPPYRSESIPFACARSESASLLEAAGRDCHWTLHHDRHTMSLACLACQTRERSPKSHKPIEMNLGEPVALEILDRPQSGTGLKGKLSDRL